MFGWESFCCDSSSRCCFWGGRSARRSNGMRRRNAPCGTKQNWVRASEYQRSLVIVSLSGATFQLWLAYFWDGRGGARRASKKPTPLRNTHRQTGRLTSRSGSLGLAKLPNLRGSFRVGPETRSAGAGSPPACTCGRLNMHINAAAARARVPRRSFPDWLGAGSLDALFSINWRRVCLLP